MVVCFCFDGKVEAQMRDGMDRKRAVEKKLGMPLGSDLNTASANWKTTFVVAAAIAPAVE